MPAEAILKALGTITKGENLVPVEHKIMPHTLVLESSIPFPGYHGRNLPEKPGPNIIYLVTEIHYDGEEILRAARKIKEFFPSTFDAGIGQAEILTNTYHLIRLRNLDCFDCIPHLQEAFTQEGIRFMKKKNVSGEALIKLQKFFRLKRIDEFIYKDLDEPLMFYFEIPDKPRWEFFRKIAHYIRSNIDNYTFDAALGTIYQEDIKDIVRIYAKDLTGEQLKFIRKKFLYELAHPDHLE